MNPAARCLLLGVRPSLVLTGSAYARGHGKVSFGFTILPVSMSLAVFFCLAVMHGSFSCISPELRVGKGHNSSESYLSWAAVSQVAAFPLAII